MDEFDSEATYCSQIEKNEVCATQDTSVTSEIKNSYVRKLRKRTKNFSQQTEYELEKSLLKCGTNILAQLININEKLGKICQVKNKENKFNKTEPKRQKKFNVGSQKQLSLESQKEQPNSNGKNIFDTGNENMTNKKTYPQNRKNKKTPLKTVDFWKKENEIPQQWLNDFDDW